MVDYDNNWEENLKKARTTELVGDVGGGGLQALVN